MRLGSLSASAGHALVGHAPIPEWASAEDLSGSEAPRKVDKDFWGFSVMPAVEDEEFYSEEEEQSE